MKNKLEGIGGKKILITEDQDSSYQLLEVLLKLWKIEPIRARNGHDAVEMCRNDQTIDLVLMDILLPDCNGLEATKKIKEIRPSLPIIAQTAYALVGDREKAIDSGCDEYITKPIRKEILMDLLERFL